MGFLLFAALGGCESPASTEGLVFERAEVVVRVPPCEAACGGRVCGSDGCGGSCGWCPEGEECAAGGNCVPDDPSESRVVEACPGRDCFSTCVLWDIDCQVECLTALGVEEDSVAVQVSECGESSCLHCAKAVPTSYPWMPKSLCELQCFVDECVVQYPECLVGDNTCWAVIGCTQQCNHQPFIRAEGGEGFQVECEQSCLMEATITAHASFLGLVKCIAGACGPGSSCNLKQMVRNALERGEGPCVVEINQCFLN